MDEYMSEIGCKNCPHECVIPQGGAGRCGVRSNTDGELDLPYYGFISASGIDPIEKKPLAHFHPGTQIPSFGFIGCNLCCPFCQNWQISQSVNVAGEYSTPERLVRIVETTGFSQVAYTYSEPLVHAEFIAACMSAAREKNISNVLVTNGCCTPDVAKEILSLTDAANIDLKCFSRDKYEKTLGGNFAAVLSFIETAFSLGVHIELTTLVVTGFNDTLAELSECADYISGISRDIPWHITAYHPAYKYNAPPTDRTLLKEAAKSAGEKLTHVHIGN